MASGSRPSGPNGGRASSSGRRPGAFGPNGLIKPPLSDDSGGRGRPPSNPRGGSNPRGSNPRGGSGSNPRGGSGGGPRSRAGGRPSGPNGTLARMQAPRSPSRYEDDSREAPAPRRGRSVGQMARDLSANVSRSLQSIGRAVRDAGRYEPPERDRPRPRPQLPPEMLDQMAEMSDSQPYRRSRARLLARKWRLMRGPKNPAVYATVVGLLVAVLVGVLGVGGVGGVYSYTYYDAHRAQIQQIYNLRFGSSTQILDRMGNVLWTAHPDDSGFSIYAPYSHISDKLKWATIETEDHTFWDNAGVDLQATIRALTVDARSGGATQGASTITQQLVKNIVAKDKNKTVNRKVNEAILAYGVTANYTKAQILEMYLNTIDYSDRNVGIESAAQNYFGLKRKNDPNAKDQVILANEQLDWAQAALLAGIPNAPGKYQPNQYTCSADKLPCTEDQWDNPCLGNPHEIQCVPNPNYDYTPGIGGGHEWLVYRRALIILANLQNYGHITKKEHDDAAAEIHDMLVNQKIGHWLGFQSGASDKVVTVPERAPHFVDYVIKELANDFGISFDDLQHAGLKIYTTLDINLDEYAANQAAYYIAKPHVIRWANYAPTVNGRRCPTCVVNSLAQDWNAHNAAVMAIDPHTGDILAMVGSVDYNDKSPEVGGNFNAATSPRSMGSSTKALVYATAFQMGWNPATMMQDQPICWPVPSTINDPGKPDDGQPYQDANAPACIGWYTPHNFEPSSFSGHVPARFAIANSLNVPATEAMSYVGGTYDTAAGFISMANRMGIDTLSASRIGPTTALGTQEIPLSELTSAFGTFAAGGKHTTMRSILRIDGPDGTSLYKAPAPQPQQVMSPQAAYMMNSILSDNDARIPDFNTGNPLDFRDFPVASKTGTASGVKGPSDIITMGYTPYLAVGVWVGNDNNADLRSGILGIAGAGYIFADVMQWAIDNYKWPKVKDFPIPPGMARGQFNCMTGLAPYAGQGVIPCPYDPYYGQSAFYKSTNIYATYPNSQRVNEDWYLQGQPWLQS